MSWGWREDNREVRVSLLGMEVSPVDEEGVLPMFNVAEDKDGELHLINVRKTPLVKLHTLFAHPRLLTFGNCGVKV